MIKLTDNNCELYMNAWDEGGIYTVYRDESIGIKVTHPGIFGTSNDFYDLTINGNFIASYLTDKKGELKIELNYAISNFRDYSYFTLELSNKNVLFTKRFYIKPGVSKNNLMFPVPKEYIEVFGKTIIGIGGHTTRDTIFPPNVIYKISPFKSSTDFAPIIFESTYDNYYTIRNFTANYLHTLNGYPNSFIIDEDAEFLMLTDINKREHRIPLTEIDECKEYAILRWISKFGQLRQHIFKVDTITDSIASSIDIIEFSNATHKEKNTNNSITILIEGLTRYSLWYYQDILTSKEIHATKITEDALYQPMGSVIETLNFEHTLVDVSDSEVQLNPGTGFYDLEMNLIFKQFRRY